MPFRRNLVVLQVAFCLIKHDSSALHENQHGITAYEWARNLPAYGNSQQISRTIKFGSRLIFVALKFLSWSLYGYPIHFSLTMEDRGVEYGAILIMFTVLSFIFVCLRCFVRFKFTKLGWDDLLAVLALVCRNRDPH
jgi:hypothetical protein